MSLDATVGGVAANAYLTVAAATALLSQRLHTSDWTGADPDNQSASLIWATRLIEEKFEFDGSVVNNVQKLRWPRIGTTDVEGRAYLSTEIPPPVQIAASELALVLIKTDTTSRSSLTEKGLSDIKVGPITMGVDRDFQPDIIPRQVVDTLKHVGDLIVSVERSGGRIANVSKRVVEYKGWPRYYGYNVYR